MICNTTIQIIILCNAQHSLRFSLTRRSRPLIALCGRTRRSNIRLPSCIKIPVQINPFCICLPGSEILLHIRTSFSICKIRLIALLNLFFQIFIMNPLHSILTDCHPIRIYHRNNMQANILKHIFPCLPCITSSLRIPQIIFNLIHCQNCIHIFSGMHGRLNKNMMFRIYIPKNYLCNVSAIRSCSQRIHLHLPRIPFLQRIQILLHLFIRIL